MSDEYINIPAFLSSISSDAARAASGIMPLLDDDSPGCSSIVQTPGCTVGCQVTCMVGCQVKCMIGCQLNCMSTAEVCNNTCQSTCQVNPNQCSTEQCGACNNTCQTTCQSVGGQCGACQSTSQCTECQKSAQCSNSECGNCETLLCPSEICGECPAMTEECLECTGCLGAVGIQCSQCGTCQIGMCGTREEVDTYSLRVVFDSNSVSKVSVEYFNSLMVLTTTEFTKTSTISVAEGRVIITAYPRTGVKMIGFRQDDGGVARDGSAPNVYKFRLVGATTVEVVTESTGKWEEYGPHISNSSGVYGKYKAYVDCGNGANWQKASAWIHKG